MNIRESFYKAREAVKPWLVSSIRLSGYSKIPRKSARGGKWIGVTISDKKSIVIK